jgi:hypothetical protein
MVTTTFRTETTPARLSDDIRNFVAELSESQGAEWVPVEPLPDGEVGWCYKNVAKMVSVCGGTPVNGWLIWERFPLYLTAEFHTVLRTPDGDLFCLTPKPEGEQAILFAPAPEYGSDFDFHNKRPSSRRLRTYQPTPVPVETVLAALTDSQKQYESRRATLKNMSIEAWLAAKRSTDALAPAIDAFLATSDEVERILVPHPKGRWCADPERYAALQKRKLVELRQMEALAWQTFRSKRPPG